MTTIDIASLNKVDDIIRANVGDYVSCDYTYNEGFSNFGLGSMFNFICVKSTINESVLISDRVINNLSFDDINKKGFIYGKEILPYEGSLSKFLVRSLSGSNNGFGCEYEEYIVNSNLGGLIVAGDSDIWNWETNTITNSVLQSDNSKAIIRGGSNVSNRGNCTLGNKSVSNGFRPMLIVTKARSNPSFVLDYDMGASDKMALCIKDIFVHKDHKHSKEIYTINIYSGDDKLYSNEYTFIEGENIDIIFGVSGFVDNAINEVTVELVDSFGLKYLAYFKAYRVSDNIILFKDYYTSNVIHNKLNRQYAIADIEDSQGLTIVVITNNNDYKIINIGDIFEVNCESVYFMIFTNNSDVSIDALGVAFIEYEL